MTVLIVIAVWLGGAALTWATLGPWYAVAFSWLFFVLVELLEMVWPF